MTNTISALFAAYNKQRVAANLQPLKAWKGSKEKLQERIAFMNNPVNATMNKQATKLPTAVAKGTDHTVNTTPLNNERDKAVAKKLERRLSKVGVVSTEPKKATGRPVNGDSAAQILQRLGIDPRKGRSLLRRHNVERTETAITAFFKSRG